MAEEDINKRFEEMDSKLDKVLEYVEQQSLRSKEVEDLVKDASIVGNDMFKATVDELEHKSVELNPEEFKSLLIRLVKNVENINNVIAGFESMNDLFKDLGPIIRSMGFDVIEKIEEYENKGYFEISKNIFANMDNILRVFVILSQPEVISKFEKMIKVATTVKIDDEEDDKSLFNLFRQLSKPEIRKTMSYSLRMIQEMNNGIKTN